MSEENNQMARNVMSTHIPKRNTATQNQNSPWGFFKREVNTNISAGLVLVISISGGREDLRFPPTHYFMNQAENKC